MTKDGKNLDSSKIAINIILITMVSSLVSKMY
jgi:hypothetical protein